MTRPYSKSHFETLYTFPERNSRSFNEQEHLKRPLKLTNLSIPEVIINDNSAVRKSSILTYHQPNPKSYRISISTSTNGIKPMDFRPLITHGRRKFSAIPSASSSSSMVITKKKSPSPMNSLLSNQKPLTRSIPVDIINNNMAIVVSSMIPSSSLSYSSSYSSSSSTSTSSTNVGTVFLPIEVTKSQNNKNNNNSIRYSNISIINEGQRDYHYVQNQIDQQERFKFQKSRHRFLLDDIDVDESTRISSSSSNGGEGHNYQSTALMDSHVLRLIRRYDPVSPHPTGIRSRVSLENTRNVWHTVESKSVVPQSLDSSAFLSNRSFTTTYEDERPTKQPSVSRLQRQQAFYEPDPPPPPLPPPPPPPSNSLRPILRYSSSRARSEFIVQPYQNESPVVDVPPFPNESAATYQPSTPTGSRRVCSALSKSAWDLRLQQEQLPIRPPSPIVINQQQERESYRPVLGRSKSSIAINYVHDEDEHRDDFDEISAPITENGSYVEKLKRLFVTKSPFDYTNPSLTNQHRNDSVDSNLNRQLNRNNNINNISSPLVRTTPNRNSIESEQRIINDSTTSSYNQTPVLRHQRTMDSLETVNRPTSGSFMPAPDLSYESYRFSRPNDINSPTIRSRNIAKVEPYSINTNAVRPLYQSSSLQPNTMTATTAIPSKARISLNSMENTPTNSSTSSSHGGILRHSNLQHSDFLMPNPTYSTTPLQPISNSLSYTTPPVLLSESLSHGSLHQLPAVNSLSYNGRTSGLISSTNNSRQIYPVTTQTDFHPSMPTSSRLGHSTNLLPSTAYHYRPSATTIITNSRQQQQQLDIPTRSTVIEQQQQDEAANSGSQQHQSRRRFQRRKQIKRSKSVDAYHDASMANNDFNKSSHHQRSTSRENLARENLSLSSSSSSASLTADIERVNRTALLRYKSLDSMTFNNQKLNSNDKNKNNPNHRRAFSKPAEFDFDSDDSVCGIPKPRKLCASSKNAAKSDGTLLHSSTIERDHRHDIQAISVHDIGSRGTHTGITNSVRKNETTNEQTYPTNGSTPSTKKISTNGNREGEEIIQPSTSGIALAESQFYARSSDIPHSKRHDLNSQKVDEFHSSKPMKDGLSDNINILNRNQVLNNKVLPINRNDEGKIIQNQELFISEPVDINSSGITRPARPLSNAMVNNPFERLRPMDIQNKQQVEEDSLQIFDRSYYPPQEDEFQQKIPLKTNTSNHSLIEQIQDQFDDNNDSSTSTTTNRSVHLPVEKQRGLSEIIRKRNSRYKVEDYKRSIQKPTTSEEQQPSTPPLSTSRNDHESIIIPDLKSKSLTKAYSMDVPIELEKNTLQRAQLSIERLNVLLSNEEQPNLSNEIDDQMSVANKRSLFETITNDTPMAGTIPRSKSFKNEDSSNTTLVTKKHINGNRHSHAEEILLPQQNNENSPEKNQDDVTFDDDISKLSFKEKMVLFNKKKNMGFTPTSSLKNNRSRLTQPITAEEVQAAVNLTPSSSSKELAATFPVDNKYLMHDDSLSLSDDYIFSVSCISQENDQHVKYLYTFDDENISNSPQSENVIPVSKRLEHFKAFGEPEWIKPSKSSEKLFASIDEHKSTRKTPTLKYNAKKTNTDPQHRAKTIDIVRLKSDSVVKPKEINIVPLSTKKTNGTTSTKSNQNVISVLKSDTISVLKPDDHLDNFFADTNKNVNDNLAIQLNTDDLNRIAENTVRLQSQAPRARPPRRQQQGAKNPLRQIQATIPTEDEYMEIHTNISEQEVRRLKRAQIAEHAGLAQEALAALAATENFAEINLRKIDETPVAKFGYEPYQDLMLILIKGRRQCSLRLINPIYDSVNEGDCYLLITPLKVFAWIGRNANTLEKARAADIIDYLKQHRDFGLRNEVKYFLLDQAKDDTEDDTHAEFRDILQGEIDDYRLMDDVIDDEFYETNIIELNRVYRVEDDLLMPLDDFCFRSLSVKILDPNEVFVFDFGSELYVWNGKYADKTKRNMGLQLGYQLWNDPYDYSECTINVFDPLDDKNESTNQSGSVRPEWCIFGKQNQNVETLLFKGKFYDWPSEFQELKPVNDTTNKVPSTQRPRSILDALKPADVHKMLTIDDNPVNFILEQVSLGRGKYWYDPIEKRGQEVQTISLNVWHVTENDRHELPQSSYGQFYSDDVYIIRWRYKLNPILNNKSSGPKPDVGRNRVAYWIWQGLHTSPNEKGISALMTVFFEEEKGPHIHVIQEHEEATFLQLFDGTLTIHRSKRNQTNEKKSNWYLYVFLGEIDVETHWWELNAQSSSLRSRTSFLLINNHENLMLLWHGCGTSDDQQMLAAQSAMNLRERCPEEFHFEGHSDDIELFEMQEGDEIELFWEGINERNHERNYNSLLNDPSNAKPLSTMRIFHLSSLHGPFVAQELLYPLRSSDHISPFPFNQSDLYELHQPALCLIDTNTEIYIWQGWNDQADDELGLQLSNANLLVRAPRDIRFTTERRCAFRTALDYYKTKTGSSNMHLPCSIVYAGLEPIDFTNLFPKWIVNAKARQQNQLEGKKLNQKDSVIDILNQLCREQYSIEELRARPLPEGVDPSKIESYLSDADFQKEFHLSKDEFYALPYWKQTNIKKPLGFF